jgi:GNAT superfamily N-acetyltransferase
MEAVRPATSDDESRLRALAGELSAGLVAQRGGRLLFASDPSAADGTGMADRLTEAVGAPGRLVLVGTLDGVVTGFAWCTVVEHRDRDRRGVLEACYVEPAARGVGLGHLLADAAMAWLEGQGATGVDGIALPGDRQAKNFFESSGFKARMLTMYRPLE